MGENEKKKRTRYRTNKSSYEEDNDFYDYFAVTNATNAIKVTMSYYPSHTHFHIVAQCEDRYQVKLTR